MIKSKKSSAIRMIVFLFVFAFLFGLFIRLLKFHEYLISGSIYYIGMLAFLLYTIKAVEKESLESIGFDLRSVGKKIISGIGVFAILEIIFTLYFFMIYGTKPNFVHLTLAQTLLNIIYFVFLVGFVEELVFRGYLLERFNEIFNSKIYSVLLSSAIFALWHYPVSYYFGQVIFGFFFGVILSIIKVKSKKNDILSLAIGHGLYNSFIYLGGYFIK